MVRPHVDSLMAVSRTAVTIRAVGSRRQALQAVALAVLGAAVVAAAVADHVAQRRRRIENEEAYRRSVQADAVDPVADAKARLARQAEYDAARAKRQKEMLDLADGGQPPVTKVDEPPIVMPPIPQSCRVLAAQVDEADVFVGRCKFNIAKKFTGAKLNWNVPVHVDLNIAMKDSKLCWQRWRDAVQVVRPGQEPSLFRFECTYNRLWDARLELSELNL